MQEVALHFSSCYVADNMTLIALATRLQGCEIVADVGKPA